MSYNMKKMHYDNWRLILAQSRKNRRKILLNPFYSKKDFIIDLYKKQFGHMPNLDNPVLFTEKQSALKINKNAIYITALNNCVFNDTELKKDCIYCVKFELLNREKTKNQEYFLQKELIKYLPNSEEKLLEELSNIISEV